jgi:hypothetical protein
MTATITTTCKWYSLVVLLLLAVASTTRAQFVVHNITADGSVFSETSSQGSGVIFSISPDQIITVEGGQSVISVSFVVDSLAASEIQVLMRQGVIPTPDLFTAKDNYRLNSSVDGQEVTVIEMITPVTPNLPIYVGIFRAGPSNNGTTPPTPPNNNGTNNGSNNGTTPTPPPNSNNATKGLQLKKRDAGFFYLPGSGNFNISVWATSDRTLQFNSGQQYSLTGSLKQFQPQYYHVNLPNTNQAFYVVIEAQTPLVSDSLQLFLSTSSQYPTPEFANATTTFEKTADGIFHAYILLGSNQVSAINSTSYSVLVYGNNIAGTTAYSIGVVAPLQSSARVAVNTTQQVQAGSFSLVSFELTNALLNNIKTPLLVSVHSSSVLPTVYLAFERYPTQYDFDFAANTTTNSTNSYLLVKPSQVKIGSWFLAVYNPVSFILTISFTIALPGDASLPSVPGVPVSTQVSAYSASYFSVTPRTIFNTTGSTTPFLEFDVISSPDFTSLSALESDDSESGSGSSDRKSTNGNFTIYGRWGDFPTPNNYDSISQVGGSEEDDDEDDEATSRDRLVLCANVSSTASSSEKYYISIQNHGSTTLSFTIRYSPSEECPASEHHSKAGKVVGIVIVVILVVAAAVVLLMYLKRRQQHNKHHSMVGDGVSGTPSYRLLHHDEHP